MRTGKKPCRECGKEVSPRAVACPYCRTPTPVSSTFTAVGLKAGNRVFRMLGWVVGGLLLLAGVVGLFDQWLSGLATLALGAIFFPPLRDLFQSKSGIALTVTRTALLAVGLLLLIGLTAAR